MNGLMISRSVLAAMLPLARVSEGRGDRIISVDREVTVVPCKTDVGLLPVGRGDRWGVDAIESAIVVIESVRNIPNSVGIGDWVEGYGVTRSGLA